MSFERLGTIVDRVVAHLAPVTYIVPVQGALAVRLEHYAIEEGVNAETIIAEAVRAYLGDAA